MEPHLRLTVLGRIKYVLPIVCARVSREVTREWSGQ